MNIRAVIHDFDGVLNDSFHEGLRRIRNICATFEVNFTPVQRKKLTQLWGIPGEKLLQQGLDVSPAMARRLYAAWERLDIADPTPLVPGAKEHLFWLRRNGFCSGLLTSRNRPNIESIFEEVDLMREFTVISTKQESPYSKPDPRVFDYILGEFKSLCGITKEECIFVGDTPADMKAGHEVGIETILVQTGPYLLRHAAELPIPLENVLNSIDDLPLWIEEHHNGEIKHPYI